ncbi:hypothetical protein BsWGS_22587 [Bradybaena similaris]
MWKGFLTWTCYPLVINVLNSSLQDPPLSGTAHFATVHGHLEEPMSTCCHPDSRANPVSHFASSLLAQHANLFSHPSERQHKQCCLTCQGPIDFTTDSHK